MCHRRVEIPDGSEPSGWKQASERLDHLWHAHGDKEPQARDFCKPACQTAWSGAEREGLAAFREVMRRARLDMQSAVDALAEIKTEEPSDLPF